jgi:hypothetical protein
MSLILDALRKLERQKAEHEPSVLVVGSVPWGGTSRTKHLRLAVGAAVVLASGVLVGWLLRPAAPPSATAALPAAAPRSAEPTPRPTPTSTPPPVGTAGAQYELPSAPPVRLSRPVPAAPGRVERATSALPDPTPAPPTPEPAPESPPAPAPAESISIAPGVVETAPAAAPDELRLTAISQRDGRPVALINDRLVFEGDSFDGVRVLRIGETEVEVEVRGVRRVLRF